MFLAVSSEAIWASGARGIRREVERLNLVARFAEKPPLVLSPSNLSTIFCKTSGSVNVSRFSSFGKLA